MIRQLQMLALAALLAGTIAGAEIGTGTAGGKTAFAIVAGQGPANAGLNFNGADKGRLVMTVPVGAEVQITLTNKGDLPHSVQVIPYTTKLPGTAAAAPVFPGAQTPDPQAGLTKGQTATIRFTAAKAGKYLLICGFPGHALLGMYGVLEVAASKDAAPKLTITK